MKEMSKECSTDQRFILKEKNFLKNQHFSVILLIHEIAQS